MDRSAILNALTATLDPNLQVRKQAEAQLSACETQPGFTAFCLDVAIDDSITPSQRSSSAVYFKNRIYVHWGGSTDRAIGPEEQEQIKTKIIEALVKCYNDSHIRPQLTVAVKHILSRGGWDLNQPINHLITNTTDPAYCYTGLLLLLEATKSLRYKYDDHDRQPLNNYINNTFPILEQRASHLIQQTDYMSGEMMYYILKIFKYATLVALPTYFHQLSNLETWVSLHLAITQKPLPQEVLDVEPSDRILDKRVKCQKWGFGNLSRFYQRYCTPTSKNASPEFIEYFNKTYVPQILQVYFGIVEKWGSGSWLSDSSLYNLISFFEKCIMTEAWSLIQPHYSAILRHLIFPCLCQENLELFEDDPEEYIRRYLDINRESNTADIAAVDALFVTAHHRFEEINGILGLLNEVFTQFFANQSEETALKAEGGLRVLSSISFALTKKDSPFLSQVDQMIDSFVVPLLTSQFLFLRARSCETVSIFSHTYTDKNVLSKVFQGVHANFNNTECLPVQIEAADALKVLITDSLVIDAIRPEVPSIMKTLLSLSKVFELDMLAEIMEAFVETFSDDLEPFAVDMGQSLCDQFIRTATEMMEMQTSGGDSAEDKEYQAIGFMNTMTTMTMSMTKVNLEPVFMPAIEFVVQNASISFLTEAMELAESLISAQRNVSDNAWKLYSLVIDSFQTYAAEFFETYIPFFEAVIVFGFKGLQYNDPKVTALKQALHELIASPVDYDNVGAIELLEYIILTFNEFNDDLVLVLKKFKEEELAPHSIVRILLASMSVDSVRTLQVTESLGETLRLSEIWFNLSTSFETVYGLKLQILGLLGLLSTPQIPGSIVGYLQQFSVKLFTCVSRLPEAISKRQEQLKADYYSPVDYEDVEYEADEDVFKSTPLDDLNSFVDFNNKFTHLHSVMPERHQQIMDSLSVDQKRVLHEILMFITSQEQTK